MCAHVVEFCDAKTVCRLAVTTKLLEYLLYDEHIWKRFIRTDHYICAPPVPTCTYRELYLDLYLRFEPPSDGGEYCHFDAMGRDNKYRDYSAYMRKFAHSIATNYMFPKYCATRLMAAIDGYVPYDSKNLLHEVEIMIRDTKCSVKQLIDICVEFYHLNTRTAACYDLFNACLKVINTSNRKYDIAGTIGTLDHIPIHPEGKHETLRYLARWIGY